MTTLSTNEIANISKQKNKEPQLLEMINTALKQDDTVKAQQIFYHIVKVKTSKILENVITQLDPAFVKDAIASTENTSKETALHAATRTTLNKVNLILEQLTQEEQAQLIQQKNKAAKTPLELAKKNNKVKKILPIRFQKILETQEKLEKVEEEAKKEKPKKVEISAHQFFFEALTQTKSKKEDKKAAMSVQDNEGKTRAVLKAEKRGETKEEAKIKQDHQGEAQQAVKAKAEQLAAEEEQRKQKVKEEEEEARKEAECKTDEAAPSELQGSPSSSTDADIGMGMGMGMGTDTETELAAARKKLLGILKEGDLAALTEWHTNAGDHALTLFNNALEDKQYALQLLDTRWAREEKEETKKDIEAMINFVLERSDNKTLKNEALLNVLIAHGNKTNDPGKNKSRSYLTLALWTLLTVAGATAGLVVALCAFDVITVSWLAEPSLKLLELVSQWDVLGNLIATVQEGALWQQGLFSTGTTAIGALTGMAVSLTVTALFASIDWLRSSRTTADAEAVHDAEDNAPNSTHVVAKGLNCSAAAALTQTDSHSVAQAASGLLFAEQPLKSALGETNNVLQNLTEQNEHGEDWQLPMAH